jgi:SHS2 domain-containing protein
VNEASDPAEGHRIVPHTADVIIEGWGETPVQCLEEAARALIATFADIADVAATDTVPVMFDLPPDDEEALVAVLEEIVYLLDAAGVVPVDVELEETDDGGVAGYFETAPADRVDVSGASPKGVSRSELELRSDRGRWSCRAVIDV